MYSAFKNIMDRVVALIALLICSPLFLLIMVVLRFSGEGEIFYFQKRIGYKNKYFNAIKFATMIKNSLNIGTGSITLRNDPRVTSIGKFLRKSKLNELPQIINVLIGDMSIVGPRPLVDATFASYDEMTQQHIYDVMPGITGLGSVIFRDEEKYISESNLEPKFYYNQEIAPHKGKLELWYIEHQSFWIDLKIILLTAYLIFVPSSNLVNKWFPTIPTHSLFNKSL